MFRTQLQKKLGLRTPRKAPASGDASVRIIGRDHVSTDGIDFDGTVQIDGCVDGDVRCTRLVITSSGRVDGAVSARIVHLDGTVNGPIDADRVFLAPSAVVKGNISYEALNVATGASISGICRDRRRARIGQCDDGLQAGPPPRTFNLVWPAGRRTAPSSFPSAPTIAFGGGVRTMKGIWEAHQRWANAAESPFSPLRIDRNRPGCDISELVSLLKLQRRIS